MEWAAVIASVLGIILVALKQWAANSPAREKEAADEKIQQGRQDIVSGNVDAMQQRIDSVRDSGNGSFTGCESAEDVERRISKL